MRTALFLAFLLGTSTYASAAVITFDDYTTGSFGTLSGGYGGLDWSNFSVLNSSEINQDSGYEYGTVSPEYVAYNLFANPASFGSIGVGGVKDTFVFNSVALTGAWNDGLMVTITGTNNGGFVGSTTVTLSAYAPTLFTFDWTVTDVLFESFGGTPQGFNGGGTHFVMDNLTINEAITPPAVPLPAGLPLLGAGLAALGVVARRKA